MHNRPENVPYDGASHQAGEGNTRRLARRPRYRRIQDLSGDSLCNLVDNPAELLSDADLNCDDFLINPEYGQDYLPSNSFYPPGDDTQKYEYFEGSAVITNSVDGQSNEVLGIYLKKLKHPVTGGYYLSGVIHTPTKEYSFRGDMVTGQSFVTVGYKNLYPSMPPPIEPEDYDPEDDSGSSEGEEYDVDGRRLKKRNLRERSKKGIVVLWKKEKQQQGIIHLMSK